MINSKIDSARQNYEAARTFYEKLNHINNIIEIQVISSIYQGNPTIYGDIKTFILCYINAIEEKAYGYYELNREKLMKKVNLVDLKEQIGLLTYFQKTAKSVGLDETYPWVTNELKKREIQLCIKEISLKNFFKLPYYIATYNLFALLISILSLYLIYSIFLLPAPFKSMIAFRSSFVSYSKNDFVNHFLNTLMSFCDVNSDFKANPLNWKGVLLEIFMKIALLILILGYLTEELKKRLQ